MYCTDNDKYPTHVWVENSETGFKNDEEFTDGVEYCVVWAKGLCDDTTDEGWTTKTTIEDEDWMRVECWQAPYYIRVHGPIPGAWKAQPLNDRAVDAMLDLISTAYPGEFKHYVKCWITSKRKNKEA